MSKSGTRSATWCARELSGSDAFAVLTTPPPRADIGQIADFVEGCWGLRGDLSPLDSERDQNFSLTTGDGARFVVKISNSAEEIATTRYQTEALLHLRAADPAFPSPDVVRTLGGDSISSLTAADGRSHSCRILTWLNGTLMHDADIASLGASMGKSLARLHAALRDFDRKVPQAPLLWDISHAGILVSHTETIDDPKIRAICERQLVRFRERTAAVLNELPRQAIHNDFNPGNVLVDPGDHANIVGIIDFGDLVHAPRVVDLAVAAAYLCIGQPDPRREIKSLVTAFMRNIDLNEAEIGLIDELILTRLVVSTTIAHWRARQFPENSAYIMISQKDSIAALLNMHDELRANG